MDRGSWDSSLRAEARPPAAPAHQGEHLAHGLLVAETDDIVHGAHVARRELGRVRVRQVQARDPLHDGLHAPVQGGVLGPAADHAAVQAPHLAIEDRGPQGVHGDHGPLLQGLRGELGVHDDRQPELPGHGGEMAGPRPRVRDHGGQTVQDAGEGRVQGLGHQHAALGDLVPGATAPGPGRPGPRPRRGWRRRRRAKAPRRPPPGPRAPRQGAIRPRPGAATGARTGVPGRPGTIPRPCGRPKSSSSSRPQRARQAADSSSRQAAQSTSAPATAWGAPPPGRRVRTPPAAGTR